MALGRNSEDGDGRMARGGLARNDFDVSGMTGLNVAVLSFMPTMRRCILCSSCSLDEVVTDEYEVACTKFG